MWSDQLGAQTSRLVTKLREPFNPPLVLPRNLRFVLHSAPPSNVGAQHLWGADAPEGVTLIG